jgi:hypothetical protein
MRRWRRPMVWHWHTRAERLLIWVIWHLPKILVRWAFIRVVSEVCTGSWGIQPLSQIGVVEALKRWDYMEGKAKFTS